MNRDVRIGDRRLLQIFIDAAAPAHVTSFELDGYPRTAPELVMMTRLFVQSGIMRHPLDSVIGNILVSLFAGRYVFTVAFAVDDLRLVTPCIDLNLEVMRRLFRRRHRDDFHRLTRSEHAVHTGSTDADSLLAAAHPQPMEFRSVEQLAENQRDLFLDDSWTVILNADLEAVRAGGFDMYPDFRNNVCLFACIQRVVHGLFYRGEQRLARVVESEKMAIFGEKLADGDVALFGGHCFRGDTAAAWLHLRWRNHRRIARRRIDVAAITHRTPLWC